MRTDASTMLPPEPRSHGGTQSQARAGRWLADLERAMLDARPQDDAARAPKAAQARTAPAAAAVPPSAAQPAFAATAAATLPRAVPAQLTTLATAPAAAHAAPAAGQPMGGASRDAAPAAPTHSALAAVSSPDRPAATSAATSLPDAPATPPTAPLPEPRRYARRLMHASGHGHVQITLRDAALHAGQAPIVARAVFEQLREAGVCVQRIYVNGQVFAAALREPAPTPSNPHKE